MAVIVPASWPGPAGRVEAARPGVWLAGLGGATSHAGRRAAAHAVVAAIVAAVVLPSAHPRHPPGRPPDPGVPGWSLSLSYADDCILVALACAGRVGVDLMAVADLADWRAVAERHLAPAAVQAIAAAAPGERGLRFAEAWTALEAVGKCLGCGLAMPAAGPPAGCSLHPLALPAGFAGHLALRG